MSEANNTPKGEEDLGSLMDAFEAAETEANASKEEEVTPEEGSIDATPPAKEGAVNNTDEEELAEDVPEAEALNDSNPHKEEYEERIKGYQRSYTKKVQKLQEEMENFKKELRQEYEQTVKEALGNQGSKRDDSDKKTTSPSSLEELFEGADPQHLAKFKTGIKMIVDEATASLKEENDRLKSFVDSQKSQAHTQSQIQEAIEKFPELNKEQVQFDLLEWAEANPNAARGKTISEMYMLKTYHEQQERGRKAALREMQRKEKEVLETAGVGNTVEDEEFADLEAAFKASLKEQTK